MDARSRSRPLRTLRHRASTASIPLAAAAVVLGLAGSVQAARLPDWRCTHPDALFVDGIDGGPAAIGLPSGGNGGAYPGPVQRSVAVPGIGTRSYRLYLPAAYTPRHAAPLIVALHGAAGPGQAAAAAAAVALDWGPVAEAAQAIVLAPVAGGSQGGWIPPDVDGSGPSDYDVIAAAIADAAGAYNVDRLRIHGWGYSAGGAVMHDLNLTPLNTHYQAFAGYAVVASARALCPDYIGPYCEPAAAPARMPVAIRIGLSDALLPYARADRTAFVAAGWTEGADLAYAEVAGGHTYDAAGLAAAWSFLCPFRRDP